MVFDTYVPNEGITTPERLATQWSAPAEASERQRTNIWERPVQTQTSSLPTQVNDGTPSASHISAVTPYFLINYFWLSLESFI